MKVWITADGQLNICPQNELEKYALKKWCEESFVYEGEEAARLVMDRILIHGDEPTSSLATNERGI